MGMFLSKYRMLNALEYGEDQHIIKETKKILGRFKLIGLILHDPKSHSDFDAKLKNSFHRLNYLTGNDFLFIVLKEPVWSFEYLKYDGFMRFEDVLSTFHFKNTSDESISSYSISQALNIDFDDLPSIILTNSFQSRQFRVVRMCSKHLESQMTEISFFASKVEKYFNLITDPYFNEMIKKIDKYGSSYHIRTEESLAKTLSDFLAFGNEDPKDMENAKKQIKNVLTNNLKNNNLQIEITEKTIFDFIANTNINKDPKYMEKAKFKYLPNRDFQNKDLQRDSTRFERMKLFLLGCLSNLSTSNPNQKLTIDDRCENESQIILKTFNKVLHIFNTPNNKIQQFFYNDLEMDYSPLIISLCKIFEIEINLSLVHWFRMILNIEMPKYFKKHKVDNLDYRIIPSAEIVRNPRPIDFNRGNGQKWIAPGIGESELATKTYHRDTNLPPQITNYDELLRNWSILRRFRNRAAHVENLTNEEFDRVYYTFQSVNNKHLKQLNDLKMTLKQ